MVRILIIYYSRSGNTEKMAQIVAEGARQVKGAVVETMKVAEATNEDLLAADAIIVGSPTYYGSMSGNIKEFIDDSVKIHGKLEGKIGAAFASSGGTASGAETTLLSILHAMLVHGMIIQGRSDDKHYGPAAVGAPDSEAMESCRRLGKKVAELAVKVNM